MSFKMLNQQVLLPAELSQTFEVDGSTARSKTIIIVFIPQLKYYSLRLCES